MLFNWSVSLARSATRFEPIVAQVSLIDSWRDRKAVGELERLGQYAPLQPNSPLVLYDLNNAYFRFLDEYRTRNPERFSEWMESADRQTQTSSFLYGAAELGLLVLLVCGVYFVIFRRSRVRARHVAGWLMAVVLIVVAGLIFRYRLEVKLEQSYLAEPWFRRIGA